MTLTRRSMMWPLLIIAIGCVWLLMVSGALPEAVGDLLLRSWPALLVLFGLDALFGRRRLRFFGQSIEINLLVLIALLGALAGVIWLAYANQADELRTDQVVAFEEDLAPEIEQVRLVVAVERTTIRVDPEPDGERMLAAEFAGSHESEVTLDWVVEGGTGTLTVQEAYQNAVPKLEDFGRGALQVTLPVDVIIEDLIIQGDEGTVTIDLQPLRVRQVNVSVGQGDLDIVLPAQDTLQGNLTARDGGIAVTVPEQMALIVGLQPGSGTPSYEYDRLRYDVLLNGELKRTNTDAFQISLDVWLKDGAALIITDRES